MIIFLKRRQGFFVRSAACWLVGLTFAVSEQNPNLDLRLRLRPSQLKETSIVLLLVSQEDWARLVPSTSQIKTLKELNQVPEGFFWSQPIWSDILQKLLSKDPKQVVMSFFFASSSESMEAPPPFNDSRIIWSARKDNDDRILYPRFSGLLGRQSALIHPQPDFDGVVRSFSLNPTPIPQIAFRLAGEQIDHDLHAKIPDGFTAINYVGEQGTFPTISLSDLLEEGQFPADFLKGKIVIVGAKNAVGHSLSTPLGPMSLAEWVANTSQMIIDQKLIQRVSDSYTFIGLFLLLSISIWIIMTYPQIVSLTFLFLLVGFLIAYSTWLFDVKCLWFPLTAFLCQLLTTFIVFQSFQLSLREQLHWKLEHGRRSKEELENLKENFIRLISHDLKTPIARLQAIITRLTRNKNLPFDVQTDLFQINSSSQELHRYIQSILRITRLESNRLQIRKEFSDLNQLIERAAENIRPSAREKNINIITSLEPLFSLEIDPELMYEVTLNLIENAVKYSPTGSTVTIRSEEFDHTVKVTVQDSGHGVDPKELPLIWNKFYRGKDSKMSSQGSGLGLYLVKFFVELHGGQVFADSKRGSGLKIGFIIPEEGSERKEYD